jgi:hydroxyacylglutathione hydrolase
MRVESVPCLRDNYAYILICPETNEAAVVDPSEAKPVERALANLGVKLTTILNTHHHPDHVGGNKKLLRAHPDLRVFAHASDRGRIPGQTEFLEEGDPVRFGGIEGGITHNPGHTTGGVTYYFDDCAFTGDTLFAAGCGRLFEGGPEDMYRSLHEKIGGHAPETKIYFGHEYTENNLRFALSVEPDNEAARAKLDRVRSARAEGRFTTPSTLADEWETNPFMRCDAKGIQETVRRHDPDNDLQPASVLGVIRSLKDRF